METTSAKARVEAVVRNQPEDASYEEIMRELAFDRMVSRGIEDVRAGRLIENDDMERRIRQWRG